MSLVNELAELAKQYGATAAPRGTIPACGRRSGIRLRGDGPALYEHRQLTRRLKGLPPGPEGSVRKLCTSELNLRINKFAMELLGPYSQMEYEAPFAYDRGKWLYRMLAARALTIAGGTSEIQHNIIGERVLGLPKG